MSVVFGVLVTTSVEVRWVFLIWSGHEEREEETERACSRLTRLQERIYLCFCSKSTHPVRQRSLGVDALPTAGVTADSLPAPVQR